MTLREMFVPFEDRLEAELTALFIRHGRVTVEVFVPPSDPANIYALVHGYEYGLRVFRRWRWMQTLPPISELVRRAYREHDVAAAIELAELALDEAIEARLRGEMTYRVD